MEKRELDEIVSHKIDGPVQQEGYWIASITLQGLGPKTFQGTTQQNVQEEMLEYLDQVVLELQKAILNAPSAF